VPFGVAALLVPGLALAPLLARRSISHHATTGTRICGQPALRSPYGYDGTPGAYRSGARGLPTYGTPRSAFPHDVAGYVIPTGRRDFLSYQLNPDTVYYLLPGVHTGSFMADRDDAFVGGVAGGRRSVLSGAYSGRPWAIDSNSTNGDQPGVTVEYLTIEEYAPNVNGGAVNQDANTGWTIRGDTITRNVPGAGIMVGADNTIDDDCLILNGQYGFQATDVDGFGSDSLTGGPYDVTVKDNEIADNDTCDLEGTLSNRAIGWAHYDPVPLRDRNPRCGAVAGDGDEGGFKLWHTNGVTISGNYIHGNWGPGAWVDTDNANTTFTGNTIMGNDGAAIIEEVSYNFSITGNYVADNDVIVGLGNAEFPSPAIYISESGSDRTFGGVPACAERSCSHQPAHRRLSVIRDNTMVDNAGNVFLWQSSNRYCSDGSDGSCTLVDGGPSGPFTVSACRDNLPSAAVTTAGYLGDMTGEPVADWWDGCLWKTENVSITHNTIDFDPAKVKDCKRAAWPDCGAGGIFSEYGSPPDELPGWVVPTALTFFQNDTWSDNTYNGPSTFYAWNQGSGDNPVSWRDWTGSPFRGDRCSSSGERQSGYCTGPFGKDAGSTYNR